MRGDARNQKKWRHLFAAFRPVQRRLGNCGNRVAKLFMRSIEQRDLGAPRRFGRVVFRRSFEKIRPFELERSAFFARQSTPDDVLPVRGVKHELPDVVSAGGRTPGGALDGQAAHRSAEIRTVPGLLVICLVDDGEEQDVQRVISFSEKFTVTVITIGTAFPFMRVG